MAPLLVFGALLGACLGSFLNVLIVRLPDPAMRLFTPSRSQCPSCGYAITARDNIPVVSWLLLQGRCRGCRAGISALYPVVEALGAMIGLLAVWQYGPTLEALTLALFLFLLLAIAATDLRTLLIPDVYTVGGGLAGLVLVGLATSWRTAGLHALEGLLVAGVLWGFARLMSLALRKDAMGSGDAFLVGMIAAFLGFGPTLVAIYVGALSGLLWHVVQRLRRRPPASPIAGEDVAPADEAQMPFGPHLAIGAVIVRLASDAPLIASWSTTLRELLPWR